MISDRDSSHPGDSCDVNDRAGASDDSSDGEQRIVSFAYRELDAMGRALNSPIVLVLMYALGLVLGVLVLVGGRADANVHNMKPNSLLWTARALLGLGVVATVVPLADVRRAVSHGGSLEALGLGNATYSHEDGRYLRRWRQLFAGMFVLVVSWTILWAFRQVYVYAFGGENFGYGATGADTCTSCDSDQLLLKLMWSVGGLFLLIVLPCLTMGWANSMLLGATLARDQVRAVIKSVQDTSPLDREAWLEKVEGPAINLDACMQLLSNGWGRGLECLTLGCWLSALSLLANAMNAERNAQVELRRDMLPPGSHK